MSEDDPQKAAEKAAEEGMGVSTLAGLSAHLPMISMEVRLPNGKSASVRRHLRAEDARFIPIHTALQTEFALLIRQLAAVLPEKP